MWIIKEKKQKGIFKIRKRQAQLGRDNMTIMNSNFAKLLKKSGKSQIEVAREAGLNPARITDYKKGKPVPPRHIGKLSRILNASPRAINPDFDFNSPVDAEILARLIYGATKKISEMGSIPMPEQVASLVAEAYAEMIMSGEEDVELILQQFFQARL